MNLLKSFSVVLSFISIASMAFSPLIILSLVALCPAREPRYSDTIY